jgi:hypothetical protein
MKTSNSDTHQENADRDLASDRSEAVGDLAEPPILHSNDTIDGLEILELVSRAVSRAPDHAATEHGVKELY